MAARRLMPGGRGVAERRRDELSASPLRRGASTQTSWTSSAQVHKRLRGGRYRTGNAIYELQFLGDLWSVEIKARDPLGKNQWKRRVMTVGSPIRRHVGLTTMVTAVTRSVRLLNNLAKLPLRSRQSAGAPEKEQDRSGGWHRRDRARRFLQSGSLRVTNQDREDTFSSRRRADEPRPHPDGGRGERAGGEDRDRGEWPRGHRARQRRSAESCSDGSQDASPRWLGGNEAVEGRSDDRDHSRHRAVRSGDGRRSRTRPGRRLRRVPVKAPRPGGLRRPVEGAPHMIGSLTPDAR